MRKLMSIILKLQQSKITSSLSGLDTASKLLHHLSIKVTPIYTKSALLNISQDNSSMKSFSSVNIVYDTISILKEN